MERIRHCLSYKHKIVFIHICLIVLFCYSFVVAFARPVVFPSCWKNCSTNVVLFTLYNVALQRCVCECFEHQQCHGANYYRLTKECGLVGLTTEKIAYTQPTKHPCVFVSLNDSDAKFEYSLSHICGDNGMCKKKTVNRSNVCEGSVKNQSITAFCPANWIQRGESCYRSTAIMETRHQAEEACKLLDDRCHLAIIDTLQKLKNFRNTSWDTKKLWIGGQKSSAGVWMWNDGTVVADWGWQPGEPSNRPDTLCMIITIDTNRTGFRDRKCATPQYSQIVSGLCEINIA